MSEIASQLSEVLLQQDFHAEAGCCKGEAKCRWLAKSYSVVENAIAVLSDMHSDRSTVYYGEFARTLGLQQSSANQQIESIWEDEILSRLHPDDLDRKYLFELRFFHFIKQCPKSKRNEYYLSEKLRMRDAHDNYVLVHHRMFYFHSPSSRSILFALCLYAPLVGDMPEDGSIINSVTGETCKLDGSNDNSILTAREKEILALINQGLSSKHIADRLFISVNTVSRHRQNILEKLNVRNSVEACRRAKELRLI